MYLILKKIPIAPFSHFLITMKKWVKYLGYTTIYKLFVSVFILQVAVAQLPAEAKLKDYIHYAQENNPGIQAAFNNWKAAIERITVAKGLPNPTLSLGFFLENVETAVGPQEYKVGIVQMIPWLGKLSTQGKIQTAQSEIYFHQLQQKRLAVESQTKLVYYDLYFLEKAIEITGKNIDLVQNWEWVVQSKYKTAISSHLDVIKTQIELINLNDELKTLEGKRKPLMRKFQEILNDRTLTEVFIEDSLEFINVDLEKSELLKIAFISNPGLLAAGSQVSKQSHVLRRAKLEYFPDFGLGIDRIGTGEKLKDGIPVAGSGKDPLVFKLSLNIPIWLGKNAKTVQSAKYKKYSAEAYRQNVENSLLTDIENIWYDLIEAERKYNLYKNILIPKSLESLGASEKAYIIDEVDFLTLVDAQRRYLHFSLKYEKSLVDYLKSRSKLETLIGNPIGS